MYVCSWAVSTDTSSTTCLRMWSRWCSASTRTTNTSFKWRCTFAACIPYHTIPYIHTSQCIHIHTHSTYNKYIVRICAWIMNTHIYIHTYIHTYIHIYTYIYTYIHTSIHTYARVIWLMYSSWTGFDASLALAWVIFLFEGCIRLALQVDTHTYIHTYIHRPSYSTCPTLIEPVP